MEENQPIKNLQTIISAYSPEKEIESELAKWSIRIGQCPQKKIWTTEHNGTSSVSRNVTVLQLFTNERDIYEAGYEILCEAPWSMQGKKQLFSQLCSALSSSNYSNTNQKNNLLFEVLLNLAREIPNLPKEDAAHYCDEIAKLVESYRGNETLPKLIRSNNEDRIFFFDQALNELAKIVLECWKGETSQSPLYESHLKMTKFIISEKKYEKWRPCLKSVFKDIDGYNVILDLSQEETIKELGNQLTKNVSKQPIESRLHVQVMQAYIRQQYKSKFESSLIEDIIASVEITYSKKDTSMEAVGPDSLPLATKGNSADIEKVCSLLNCLLYHDIDPSTKLSFWVVGKSVKSVYYFGKNHIYEKGKISFDSTYEQVVANVIKYIVSAEAEIKKTLIEKVNHVFFQAAEYLLEAEGYFEIKKKSFPKESGQLIVDVLVDYKYGSLTIMKLMEKYEINLDMTKALYIVKDNPYCQYIPVKGEIPIYSAQRIFTNTHSYFKKAMSMVLDNLLNVDDKYVVESIIKTIADEDDGLVSNVTITQKPAALRLLNLFEDRLLPEYKNSLIELKKRTEERNEDKFKFFVTDIRNLKTAAAVAAD